MEEIFVRYAHFLGIILLSSMLVTVNVLISKTLKQGVIKKIALLDGIYGFAAIVTLVAGFLLWLSVGKPKEFYSVNPLFHIKMSLFFLIALLSIMPTVFFLKNRKNTSESISVPSYILMIKRLELVLLLALPLLGVLISRGVGLS